MRISEWLLTDNAVGNESRLTLAVIGIHFIGFMDNTPLLYQNKQIHFTAKKGKDETFAVIEEIDKERGPESEWRTLVSIQVKTECSTSALLCRIDNSLLGRTTPCAVRNAEQCPWTLTTRCQSPLPSTAVARIKITCGYCGSSPLENQLPVSFFFGLRLDHL